MKNETLQICQLAIPFALCIAHRVDTICRKDL